MPLEPNELHQPLGLGREARPFAPTARALLAAAVLGAGIGAIRFLAGNTEHAGEPFATAKIASEAPRNIGSVAMAAPGKNSSEDAQPKAKLSLTGPEIEGDSGVTVIRPGGASAPGAMVIRVPDAASPVRLAAAPDPRLVERSEFGPLPRIGADGARPAQVYARPAPAPTRGRPRIALVIGGLGLNDQTTMAAITRLPGEVSLAFAPYGAGLRTQAAKARQVGHEILLQVPMEPFDYPRNNPGPQTLTSEAGATENMARLHWAMGRTSGFVGIENFLGARFTADEAAFTPVLKDLAERGLMFFDDGSSARSIAPAIGEALHVPVRRAEIVIDAAPDAEDIDAALDRLETMAREKGFACASGSALPVTLERLARWAAALGERGIDLVPITAAFDLKIKV